MKLSWTPTSRHTFFSILEYLGKKWSEKEIGNFIYEVESVTKQISENPYMFKVSKIKRNVRKAIITEHNSLFYRIKPRKKEIELLTFWDNRQNPAKSKY